MASTLVENEKQKQKYKWTVDCIIQYIFPILGVLMMAFGVGYFFYNGFWGNISEMARLGIGFFLGVSFIAGGYLFSKELKTIADSIVGGGILILYITLIYGARIDITSPFQSAIFSESFALIVSALFCFGIAFYSIQRKSKIILMLGILGSYLTPFFIGQVGTFDYGISFIEFLLYFLLISSVLFFASFRMNLLSLLTVNILGVCIGTLSLSGLIHEGFNEQPNLSLLISFAIVSFHLAFVTLNIRKFAADVMVSSVHFVLPFLWFFIIVFELVDSSFDSLLSVGNIHFSLAFFLMALLSFLYFSLWHLLERDERGNENLQIGIYLLGFISGGIAFIDIADQFGAYAGGFFTLLSFLFAYLFLKNKQRERELAYIGTALLGVGIVFLNFHSESVVLEIFTGKNLFISFSLTPFLLFWILPKGREIFYVFREFLAYLSLVLIISLLGFDIIENTDFSFLFFFFIPAIIFTYKAISLSNRHSKSFIYASLVCIVIAYFSSFFIFWDNIFPAHHYSFFETEDSFIALFSLIILGSILLWVKKNIENISSGFHFILLLFFITVLFQLVSNEVIAIYNFFVPPVYLPDISEVFIFQGSLIVPFFVSLWWIIFSAILLSLGIKDIKLFPYEKFLGMVFLLFTLMKIFLYDLITLNVNIKVLLFMVVGGVLLGISYFLQMKKSKVSLDEK